MASLLNAYLSVLRIDFFDFSEIKDAENTLNAQFYHVINIAGDYFDLYELKKIRANVNKFFETEKLRAYKIDTVTIDATTDILSLTYNYYSSIDNMDRLIELNTVRNPYFISGDFDLLTL